MTEEPMGDQPRRAIDDQRVRLAIAAVLTGVFGAACAYALAVRHSWQHPALVVVATGCLAAVAMIVMAIGVWRRAGGRERVEEVEGWARSGNLPEGVSLGTALALVARRLDATKTAVWSPFAVLAICAGQLVLAFVDGGATAGDLTFLFVAVAYFALAAAFGVYLRLHRVPAYERLLAQGQRRLAAAPGDGDA